MPWLDRGGHRSILNHMVKHDERALDATFAALADPTRRAILARLTQGEATVNELAKPFAISVQAVSQHLKVLERAGLITRGRTAQLRPSRLHAESLRDAAAWFETYRAFWESSFDRLGARMRASDRGSGGGSDGG